ncbi:MAG: hypothetical protein PF630_10700 [Gammaproteobacteria bacterium]|jgi:hypothetical protein|nr:hypothetical protein [Gammaproteobacteria bacterium]
MRKLIFITIWVFVSANLSAQVVAKFGQTLLAPAVGLKFSNQNAVLALQNTQDEADTRYKKGRYKEAFPMYLDLAEFGDKFSQYRAAFMYEHARGVERDLIKAYAWSYVAAEEPNKPLRDYHRRVAKKLSPEELEQAKRLAADYLAEYGIFTTSNNALEVIREHTRRCTGSRVGSRCDAVTSNSFDCNLNNEGLPDQSCIKLGIVGLPGVTGQQPADIRKAEQNLRLLMDRYNPGKVELGEFVILKDEGE